MSLRDTFTQVLHRAGIEDKKLVVLVGDISHFRLQPFAKDCPGRYYNIGICEPAIVNLAAGLSKVGLYPVIHTISPFIVERSFEQLKLDFCYQGLGGNVVTVGSAFDYTNLGCTHHCYSDFSLLKTLPGSQLFYPATEKEFECLFNRVYDRKSLNYFRIPMYGHDYDFDEKDIHPGKAIRVQEGEDLTIIAVGSQLRTALAAIEPLKKSGISVDLIYIHTIKPFDAETVIQSLMKTRRCLVIEEHGIYGGVFDDVVRSCKELSEIKYASIAIPNEFLREYGSYEEHCRHLGFTVDGILQKIHTELRFDATSQILKGLSTRQTTGSANKTATARSKKTVSRKR